MRIGIRYCGGCNPRYDRVAAAEELKRQFPQAEWVRAEKDTVCDGIVIVTGCGKECVSDENLGEFSGKRVSVNGREDIPAAAEEIRSWTDAKEGGDRTVPADRGTEAEQESTGVRIRYMTEADLAGVLEVEKENFSVPWSGKSFRDMLARPESVFLVAEKQTASGAENGSLRTSVIGYAGAVVACDQGDVTNIAVLDRYKRQGVGAILLKNLLQEAAKKGAAEVFLEVREHNEPAKQLYRSQNFVPVGTRKGYYTDTKEDAVLMKCVIMEDGC